MDWNKAFEEIAAKNAAESDSVDPAKMKARFEETRALAIREGWSDAEGNSLLPEENDNEDE